jgi:hypothetical protein
MRTVAVAVLGLALCAVLPASTRAETRLTVGAGGLIPFGDLGDTTDPSARALVRLEHQPINAIGQRSPLAYTFHVAYSDLSLDSMYEDLLIAAGEDTEPYILEVGAGIRVHSRVAPFFLAGGAAYARFVPGGAGGDENGVDVHGGLGFLFPAGVVVLEAEATAHAVILDEDDLQFLAVTLGVALPF